VSSSALVDRLRAALEPHAEILDAYLFGSHARGDAAAHSDIDVAVFIDRVRAREPASFGCAAELTSILMSALGTNDIDVVVLNDAPPLLYHRVLRDGVRLVARDLAATTTREGQALSRYCDYVPQLAKIARAANPPKLATVKGRE
jgi:predicted nucleotidyltransferase